MLRAAPARSVTTPSKVGAGDTATLMKNRLAALREELPRNRLRAWLRGAAQPFAPFMTDRLVGCRALLRSYMLGNRWHLLGLNGR